MEIKIIIDDRIVNTIKKTLRKRVVIPLFAGLLVLAGAVAIAAISVPNTFTSGETISSSEVNANFTTLVNQINSNSSSISSINDGSNVVAFHVHKNGVAQSYPGDGSWAKVTFGAAEFDTDSKFDLTNDRYVPGVVGYYQLNAQVNFNPMAANPADVFIRLYKNGVSYKECDVDSYANTGAYFSGNCSVVVQVSNTTDYFEIFFYHLNGGNARNILGEARSTYFSGFKIK